MRKLIEGKDYQFVNAGDVFDDNNSGYIYGIDWLDEFGEVNDCQWFKTKEERQKCIDESE